MVFFPEIYVFLHIRWMGIFGTKWAFCHLENPDWQAVFLSKTSSVPIGKNVLDNPASNLYGVLSRDSCISSTQLNRTIWKKISILKSGIPDWQAVFLQKLTQFLLRNNVLHAPPSNIAAFLLRDISLCSVHLIGLFGTKCAFLPLESTDWQAVFH
jgi:hypothetical protein